MWPSPRKLCGTRLSLLPLSHGHAAQLAQATLAEPHLPEGCRLPVRHDMQGEISYLLERQADGKALTYVVQASTAQLLGWTGFSAIDRAHKKLEVGNTWLATKDDGLFTEMMVMLLTYGFDIAKANTIQFRAHADNAAHRSRLTALGAQLDGILRGDQIDRTGAPQDISIYSLLRTEWAKTNAQLLAQLQ
ncbi:GNAT family N-acetyltransferase [Cognatishimia maritima]|uniref:Protein N-acetyltransferase, RimJ/RimL family n=1 Tax=Cognatishimia maritima TaxID=870908 RepID=A0A1M5N152_9RHOB|nr:GNAT family protein [Cognatishimia maritima]SHG83217.1 Protein N-acetyltransferase, RimJ/RimL family [Cognatishimia maritima]